MTYTNFHSLMSIKSQLAKGFPLHQSLRCLVWSPIYLQSQKDKRRVLNLSSATKERIKSDRKQFLKKLFWGRFSKIIYIFMALIIFDRALVYQANKSITNENAGFEKVINNIKLDFNNKNKYKYGEEVCLFKYKYFIYGYQICFDQINTAKSPYNERGYYFIYSPPRPKITLFMRGDNPDDYYFKMNYALGKRLKIVRPNGSVEDILESK